jgi:hypothetical protein
VPTFADRGMSHSHFHQFPLCNYLLPRSCYMPLPFHPPWLDHSHYTCRRVQIIELLVTRFSSITCDVVYSTKLKTDTHIYTRRLCSKRNSNHGLYVRTSKTAG